MNTSTRLFDCIELQAEAPVTNLLNGKLNGGMGALQHTAGTPDGTPAGEGLAGYGRIGQ